MTQNRRTVLAALAALPSLAAPAFAASGPLNVVATTGMIADVAQIIGGPEVTVTALMGAGVDPHSYRQTRSDIVAMTRADLVLWNGLYLEAQLEEFMFNLARHQTVVAVGEAVPNALRLVHADYEGREDPHIWMDPEIWAHVVLAVSEALIAARPGSTEQFIARTNTYLANLTRLSSYAHRVLAQVPQQSRILVTAHDAFSYFGNAFDFRVEGIQGLSTESEAGLQRIGALVDMLVDNQIGAVFVESSVSDRNMRALIEGAAARGHTLTIGGELFSDAMGEPGTYEGTYLGMMDHNATVIASGLGAKVPAGGMSGKLAAHH